MSAHEAQRLANADGLDLILISEDPTTKLSVCKIVDGGKYKYDKQKKIEHSTKKKGKEIKLTLRIDVHDLSIKKKKLSEFLKEGRTVTVIVMIQRHEFDLKQDAVKMVEDFIADFLNIAKKSSNVKVAGRSVSVVLIPTV